MADKMAVLSVKSRKEIPPRPKRSRVQVKIKLMCSFGHKGIVHLYNNSTNNSTHMYLNWFIHTRTTTFSGQLCGHHQGCIIRRLDKAEVQNEFIIIRI
jgi:hypothetical protein